MVISCYQIMTVPANRWRPLFFRAGAKGHGFGLWRGRAGACHTFSGARVAVPTRPKDGFRMDAREYDYVIVGGGSAGVPWPGA